MRGMGLNINLGVVVGFKVQLRELFDFHNSVESCPHINYEEIGKNAYCPTCGKKIKVGEMYTVKDRFWAFLTPRTGFMDKPAHLYAFTEYHDKNTPRWNGLMLIPLQWYSGQDDFEYILGSPLLTTPDLCDLSNSNPIIQRGIGLQQLDLLVADIRDRAVPMSIFAGAQVHLFILPHMG